MPHRSGAGLNAVSSMNRFHPLCADIYEGSASETAITLVIPMCSAQQRLGL